MKLRSFLAGAEESELTVKDVRAGVIDREHDCTQLLQELIELDEEFGATLTAGADGDHELTRQSMKLDQLFQQFRVKWNVLSERLQHLQFLLAVERVVPDDTDGSAPVREVEALKSDILDEPSSETMQHLVKELDRDEIEATIKRISDAADGEIPFEKQLETAVLEHKEPPAEEQPLESVEPLESIGSDSNERRERMAELLSQEETPSVHLWDLLTELDGSGRSNS
jgi:hypothetical protein